MNEPICSENMAKHTLETISIDVKKKSKHPRPKKKRVRELILKQIEFYFSDAALSKDRYLSCLIKSNPFISLDVFLKFNKIRELTQNVSDISKALKHSKSLVLSEDALKVKRLTPLLPYNADDRTVYVESIPSTAGLPWLNSVFEKYGSVAYISLPKFQNSNRIKGFAFVEYKTADDANNCIKGFYEMGCKLPTNISPDELSSIKNFEIPVNNPMQEQGNLQYYQKKIVGPKRNTNKNDSDSIIIRKDIDNKGNNQSKKKATKRSRKSESIDDNSTGNENELESDSPITKRNRSESESDREKKNRKVLSKEQKCVEVENQQDTAVIEPVKKKHILESDNTNSKKVKIKHTEESIEGQDKAEESDEQPSKKSKLHKLKKTKKQASMDADDKEDSKLSTDEKRPVTPSEDVKECESSKPEPSDVDEMDIDNSKKVTRKRSLKKRKKAKMHHETLPEGLELSLQVLSKAEWKILRNKYLNLQRKHYTEMKKALRSKGANPQCEQEQSIQIIEKEEPVTVSQSKISKYARKCPEKSSGIIVSVNLPEPCLDVRGMKASTKTNVHVVHVEVKEGQTSMFVRFDAPEFATQFVESGIFKQAKVLVGHEENLHWERIKKEWESRTNGGKRQMRGGDRLRLKIVQAAAHTENAPSSTPASQVAGKHLRFDD